MVAGSPGPEPPPTQPSATPPPEALAEFKLVKEFACDAARLHALRGKTFASCGQELWVVDGDEIRYVPSYQRGIEREQPSFLWGIDSIAGDWPEAAWLGTNRTTNNSARGRLHRWNGQRWVKVGDAEWWEPLYDLLPWTNQTVLALVQPANTYGARFIPLGKKPFTAPTFTRPALPYRDCFTRIHAEAQAVLGPGDIMVAGARVCEVVMAKGQKDGVYAGIGVERFHAESPQGELMLLPGVPEEPIRSSWEVTALAAVTPRKVLLAAHAALDGKRNLAYFARWNGTEFVSEPPPIEGGVGKMWVESPKVLWATDLQGQLWRARAAAWRKVPWALHIDSPVTEITQVWARGPDDVWVVVWNQGASTSAVYHGKWAT
jgi:hypothetical protein